MSQDSVRCVICGAICNQKQWLVYDGLTDMCKCKNCYSEKKNFLEYMTRPFKKIEFDRDEFFITLENSRVLIEMNIKENKDRRINGII